MRAAVALLFGALAGVGGTVAVVPRPAAVAPAGPAFGPDVQPVCPELTNGPTYYAVPPDWTGYTVYLDFGGLSATPFAPSQNTRYRVFQRCAELLQPAGLTVTTHYPTTGTVALRPGAFTRVLFTAEGVLTWRPSARGTTPRKQLLNTDWFTGCSVYVAWANDPDGAAAAAAHEAVHSVTSLDLVHDETPTEDGSPNLMTARLIQPGAKLSKRYVLDVRATAARFFAGDRFGFFYRNPAGPTPVPVQDWFNIGK